MTKQIRDWIRGIKESLVVNPGRVLEIGSLDVNGEVREFFPDANEYIGIDMQKGAGVDIVINAHDIKKRFGENSFDTVVCLEMLEHDNAFWLTLRNIKWVLKKGGFFICSTPTINFPFHPYPKDYWRFTKEAYSDVIFKGYDLVKIDGVVDSEGSPGICAIGKKL